MIARVLAVWLVAGTGHAQSLAPLTATPGDPESGRRIVLNRTESACLLCHSLPGHDGPAGNIGPPLDGVGARLDAGRLRLRLVDSTRINPESPMPAYHRIDGLARVAPAYRDKPILSAQAIEDVVAYLLTLK